MLINSVFYEYLFPLAAHPLCGSLRSSLKNTSVTTAMKGFFKENYHEESHFRPAKRMGGYLIPKIYRINQQVVLHY